MIRKKYNIELHPKKIVCELTSLPLKRINRIINLASIFVRILNKFLFKNYGVIT